MRILPTLFCVALLFLDHARAQTVVNSTFLDDNDGSYGNPAHWSPAGVPNNNADQVFNITINTAYGITVDQNATVSNLIFFGGTQANLNVINHNFHVLGTTLQLGGTLQIEAFNGAGALFDAGTFSSFSDGTLNGGIFITGDAYSPATLQFRDADVKTIGSGLVGLGGYFSKITDQYGSDALRNLAAISAGATLSLDGHDLSPNVPFTNSGSLLVGGLGSPTLFTASAGLTNFNSSSHTLTGGSFSVGGPLSGSGSGAIELRFSGADVVNNASTIILEGSHARIADLNGQDGLRNFSHNLASGVLGLTSRQFTTGGNFTNDGKLILNNASFTVAGALTNFDSGTKTLTGGSYELEGLSGMPGVFSFTGADIVHNAASISLHEGGAIRDQMGQDALRNLAENLSGGVLMINPDTSFTTAGDFTNEGDVEILPYTGDLDMVVAGTFTVPTGYHYVQTAGTTANTGTLTAEVLMLNGGVLKGVGKIQGDVFVGSGTFEALSVNGDLTLSAASTFSDRNVTVTGGLHLDGRLQIGNPLYPASTDVLMVVTSGTPLTGTFSNAPSGSRISTDDGSGSFVVNYDSNDVTISNYLPTVQPAQLLNISGRADGYTGTSAIISGFIINGTRPKKVIARGIGPSQGASGIWIDDPSLELFDGSGALIAANNNWKDTQQTEIEATGLAPTDDREAAVVMTLAPGNYTAVVQSAQGFAGRALAEIYDLDQANGRVVNISTRGPTSPQDPLIGGIIVGGNGPGNAEIVVRGIGPSLKQSGVSNAISDPTLDVRDGNGALLASNDDYYIPSEPSGVALLAPKDSHESAVQLSLPAGNYTALVQDKNNASGIALVEVYDLAR